MITPTRETNTTNTNPAVIKTCLLTKSHLCINYWSQTSSITELKSFLVISLSLLNRSLLSSWSPCACESTISFHQSYTLHFVTRLAQHLDFQRLACSCSIANIFFRSLRWRPFLEKFMVLKCLAQLCQNLLALYWALKCGNDYQLVFLASLLKHGEELSCWRPLEPGTKVNFNTKFPSRTIMVVQYQLFTDSTEAQQLEQRDFKVHYPLPQ